MTERWFEDFQAGDEIRSPGKTLTEAEMIDFAFTYDPQPFHMDKVAAEGHMYGGLIAPGWMLGAIAFRLFMMTNPWGESSLGSPGVDALRWLRPVRAGDTLSVLVTVTEVRPSRSKPHMGLVHLDWQLQTQDGETAMTMKSIQMLKKRPV
ncbi:MAG: MaoC family dehydratase [Alphaproteobacteria bacterium]|jgi:acyl dehydratase|nr:MaoC family dehydratase [Alphaproteobacteria bacterium]MDP6566757.1 MaoC family dehydratase [Alphaproteobacteria bacterium]MDP6812966.1 MaoC family dehydratase [Alphaproteobacteria bacterium]